VSERQAGAQKQTTLLLSQVEDLTGMWQKVRSVLVLVLVLKMYGVGLRGQQQMGWRTARTRGSSERRGSMEGVAERDAWSFAHHGSDSTQGAWECGGVRVVVRFGARGSSGCQGKAGAATMVYGLESAWVRWSS